MPEKPERPPEISKDMRVIDLISNYPETVGVLFSFGFNCTTYSHEMYETIQQRAYSRGFDYKALAELIMKIKKAVKEARRAGKKQKDEGEKTTASSITSKKSGKKGAARKK